MHSDAPGIADTLHPVTAAAVLRLLPTGRPRLLALGEPTHGQDSLLGLRNTLFRQLVEEAGYRTVALESDCLRGLAVDDYVTGRTVDDTPDALGDVLRNGFSHDLGASATNRELVCWMREFNSGRPAADQVRFAGFDGPLEITGAESPRRALTALHAFLADHGDAELLPCPARTLDDLLGPDSRWTEPAAMYDPARSVGRSADASRLRLLADDLVALLDAQAPQLIGSASREGWDRARLYGRTAVGLLRYHHGMADPRPVRMARLLAVRDAMMADTLLALTERGPTLAFAHNAHLQRPRSSMRMDGHPLLTWWSAGALAAARLGERYAFVATALGTIGHRGVGTPPPDTLEGLLCALPRDRCVVDPQALAVLLGDPAPAPRVSPWFGYAPFDPSQLGDCDALLFLRDLPPNPR